MGTSLTFVHFYGVDQNQVIKAFADYLATKRYKLAEEPWSSEGDAPSSGAGTGAYPDNADYLVSPRHGNWVTILPSNSSAPDLDLEEICRKVSKRIANYALILAVYDSDVVTFNLYLKGKRAARYNSNPDYFSDGPKRRPPDLELLKLILPPAAAIDKIAEVLNEGFWNEHDNTPPIKILDEQGERKYLFEENRMEDFAALLEINGKGGGYPFLGWDVPGHMNWQGFKALSVTKSARKKSGTSDRPDKYDKLIDLLDSTEWGVAPNACWKLFLVFNQEYKLKDRHVRLIPKILPWVERPSTVVTIEIPEGSPIPLPKGPHTSVADDPWATSAIVFLREISQCVEPHDMSPTNRRSFFERWWADEGPTLSLAARQNEGRAHREVGSIVGRRPPNYCDSEAERRFCATDSMPKGISVFEKFGYRFTIDVIDGDEQLIEKTRLNMETGDWETLDGRLHTGQPDKRLFSVKAEPTDKKYGDLYILQDPGWVERQDSMSGRTYETRNEHFRRGAPATVNDPDYGEYITQRGLKYLKGL